MRRVGFSAGKSIPSHWPRRLLACLVGGVFFYAGILKLIGHSNFVIQIEKFGLLPAAWLETTAWLLAALEVMAGLATLFGRRSGTVLIGLLLVLFLAVLVQAWWSGLDDPCGCFGPEDAALQSNLQSAVFRDLVLLVGVALLLTRRGSDPGQLPADLNGSV